MSAEQPVSPAAAARSALAKAQREMAARATSLPSLHLLIYPSAQCLNLSLVIYYSTVGQKRACKVLRSAEWRPQAWTEFELVEWAHRALAGWLEEEMSRREEAQQGS